MHAQRPSLSWSQALAWRLRRHLLDPVGDLSVAQVVGRLVAVQAGTPPAAEFAVRTRRRRSAPGEVARAVADGTVITTFAFRGATHLLTPEVGGVYLALRGASRMWERASWQSHYGLTPADWPHFRETVRAALTDGPLTREELGAVVVAEPRWAHLGFAFADGAGTLLKPLAWQGDMSFGPSRDGRATFQRLDQNPRWAGIPDVDDAGPRAIEAYVGAYGPTTPDHLHYWLGEGLGAGRRRLGFWFDGLDDRLAELDVDGTTAYALHSDVDDLTSTPPTTGVRLLPRHDPWVLGPGTADHRVVPPAHRSRVSRGADLVIAGGRVSGTWSRTGDEVTVDWFDDADPARRAALDAEVARVATILDRPLRWTDRSV